MAHKNNDMLRETIFRNFKNFLAEKAKENPQNKTVRDFLNAFKD